MTLYHTTYIGLGSNLESPANQIKSALASLEALPHCQHVQCSPWYSSLAVGPGEQPDYINAVVRLETQLAPVDLLHQLQAIENKHGRQRSIRWGARTLDLDLLLYDNVSINTEELQLPHPEINNRNFVIYPLYDLAPELILPNGQKLSDVASQLSMAGLHKIDSH